MEILSETEFSKTGTPFQPNYLVDIGPYLDEKIAALEIYDTELGEHPFLRSMQAVKAQALLRGCMAGCDYAEGFHVIKMIVRVVLIRLCDFFISGLFQKTS